MPYNGSGVFNRLYSWVNDAAANIKIRADRMDNEMNGMAVALSTVITKDGQTTITANLPMSGFRHTGVGNAASRTDYAAFGQVQDGKAAWVDGGGTADAITAAYSIPITTLVDGQLCYVRATAANATTTPTFSPNGLTARTIVKNGGQALVAGDIAGDGHELELRYDLTNTRWELMNPKISVTLAGSENLTNKTMTSPVINGTISGSAAPKINNFRLTLTTGVPVTTTDVTSASTVFLTPYNGNQIALFTSGQWVLLTSAQVSIALSGLTANTLYDVFAWNNAGVVTLETAAWSNSGAGTSARFASGIYATELPTQDGVKVKSTNGTAIDATRRYLGTFYATGATTTEDSEANRYLYNYYNRANRPMRRFETTVTWTYSTSTTRQANGSTANQMNFVVGVNEDAVRASFVSNVASNTAGLQAFGGMGLDSTTVDNISQVRVGLSTSGLFTFITSSADFFPGAGRHYVSWLEIGSGSGTQTWIGNGIYGLRGSLLG